MAQRSLVLTLLLILLLALVPPAGAQANQPVRVELDASDGLVLVGLYYAPGPEAVGDSGAPAVLLMHHGGSRKEAWIDFIPVLAEAGYAVLTVDLRGHGETGGGFEWALADEDALLWLAWLRDQPEVDPQRVSIVGASLGGDVGLRIMPRDEQLRTLVSLSPLLALDGDSIGTLEAAESLGPRPLYVVAAQGVEAEAEAVHALLGAAEGNIQARLYEGTACCTFLLMLERDLAPSIVTWLDTYNR